MNPVFTEIIDRISNIILGKRDQIGLALTTLFAGGHLLIEDIPGIGKTTLAKALAGTLGLDFKRIQCTSDMLPGDITGVSVFDGNSGTFNLHPGPVFTQILLADEINRTTPKTQSALLESMEEYQVTIEGTTRKLERPFFVIATQNPFEQSGTYPLPESQLDRFMMKISLGYPDREAERKMLENGLSSKGVNSLTPLLTAKKVLEIQKETGKVHISNALFEYLQDIIDFTRNSGHFQTGLSPRAGLSLLSAIRSFAYMSGRDHGLPEDLQMVLPWTVGHRLNSAEDSREIPVGKLTDLFQEVVIP